MKKSLVKFLSPVLALLMLLSTVAVFPVTVSAVTSGKFEYTVSSDNGTAIISDYTGYSDKDLIIPSKLDGYTVTGIYNYAFQRCTKLESITIPDSINFLGSLAFYHCRSLKKITVSKNNRTFSDVSGVLFNNNLSELIFYPPANNNTAYSIPQGVIHIAENAFSACQNLTNVSIPDGVTHIGRAAFFASFNLSNIKIPDSVISVGRQAFDATAWYQDQPKGLVYAGKVAYTYKGDIPENTSITLNEGTTGLAEELFYECKNLKHITIPNSVKVIGRSAFERCTNLERVTIPNGVTTIESWAFFNCTSFKSIIIPPSVTEIGSSGVGYYWSDSGETRGSVKVNNFLIYGFKGTYAEEYANEKSFQFKELINGDADLDGSVTVKDATTIQMYLAGFINDSEIALIVSDADNDEIVTVKDATQIQLQLAGLA